MSSNGGIIPPDVDGIRLFATAEPDRNYYIPMSMARSEKSFRAAMEVLKNESEG